MANFGMGHPTLNPEGAAKASDDKKWYETSVTFNSKADCFNPAKLLAGSGTIASGKSGHKSGAYADAIYASSVKDLRMSSKRLPLSELREKYKRMAIAGEVRGFEGVPFTSFETVTAATYSGGGYVTYNISLGGWYKSGNIYAFKDASGVWHTRSITAYAGNRIGFPVNDGNTVFDTTGMTAAYGGAWEYMATTSQLHSQANPTWCDIIGSPENIAATFPDGVEGMWIPEIPDGSSKPYKLNRKALSTTSQHTYTSDAGTTWGNIPVTIDATSNTTTAGIGTIQVVLQHYETQAHFTDSTDQVIGEEQAADGSVLSFDSNKVDEGNILASSLGKGVQVGVSGNVEYLNVNRVFNGVVENFTQGIANAPLMSFGILDIDGVANIGIAVDDSGVINCENTNQSHLSQTQYFYDESN